MALAWAVDTANPVNSTVVSANCPTFSHPGIPLESTAVLEAVVVVLEAAVEEVVAAVEVPGLSC